MRYIRRGRRALAVAALLLLGSNARAEPGKLDPRLIRLKRGPSAYPAGRRAAGLTYVGGQATVDVHIRLRPGADPDGIRRRFPQAVFRSLNGRYWTAEFPLSALEALDADPDLEHASAEQKARLYLDVVRSSTTSSGLFLGVLDGDSTGFLSNQGAGVVVGVVDTGIDFRHLDFVNTGSPNTSRILSLWDQTDSGGPSPGGSFAYGTQWTQAQLNAEVGSSPPHVVRETDTEGHGTHVAGIAAGNGNASTPVGTFTGLAPQADIVFVKTDLGTSHIVDGVNYIIQKAAAAGKRAVINLSLGTDLGPHDGTSSFTASIDAIAASTPVALAAGNSQGSGVHASAQLVGPIGSTTFGTSVAAGLTGALLDFWASAGTGYTVTASASGFSGSVQATNGQQVSGVIGNSLVTIYNHRSSNSNGDPEIEIEIDAPNNGTINLTNLSVAFNETSGSNGKIDGWSDPAPDIQFSAPSSASSVSDLATGSNAIAVGCYCDKNFWLSTQGFFQDNDCLGSLGSLGAISPFSGRGPTRATGSDLGRTKPDIAAPGEMVASSLSTNATPQTGETAPDGKHQFLAGTSMASPVVAGLAALVVQRRPDFTAAQVKSHILTHSRSDSDVTAQGTPLPNNAFGAGKAKACLLPAQPTSFTVSTLGTSSIQWTWAASEKATTYSLAYATNTASVIAVIPANPPSFTFSNLDADTLYGLQVTAVNACGTSQPAISPSTATLANAPSSVSAVFHASSATVTFTALPVSPQSASSFGYRLEASTASNFSGTVFSSATTNPAVSRLQLPGLTVNTQYYLRLSSLNPLGGPNPVTPSGSPGTTQNSTVAPGDPVLSPVTATSIQVNWTTGGNAAGLQYVAEATTGAGCAGTVVSSTTFNLFAVFSSLAVNTAYSFRVRPASTPGLYDACASSSTLANAPSSPGFSPVWETSMTVNWGTNGNPAQTRYLAELSPASDFSSGVVSSSTLNAFADFAGLGRNTTYYLRLSAVSVAGAESQVFSSTPTLSLPPGTASPAFDPVGSSITAHWTALAASPQSASCEGYRLEASASSDFSSALAATTSDPSASSLNVGGLQPNTTYYVRVGALNWNGRPNYVVLGSTLTAFGYQTSGTTGSGYLALALTSPFPAFTDMGLSVPPGAFPTGTTVTMAANVSFAFQNESTNEGQITSLGPNAGVDLSAGGAQPRAPLQLIFHYAPSAVAGHDPRSIVVARYVPEEQQWSLVPTQVDSGANTITAQITHFSLFAPFFVTAAPALSAVQVFPVPWMPGTGNPSFDAAALTFSNLPSDARVRIFTILGESVWEGSAGPSGVVTWDGRNSRGHPAASGTYIAVVTGSGGRKTTRVTVIR